MPEILAIATCKDPLNCLRIGQALFATLSTLLCACSPGRFGSESLQPSQPPPAHAAFPFGDYMVLDGNGYWHFSFRPDNSYRIVLNDRLVIVQHGKLSVKDNLVTFDDVSRFCLARSQGTYRWEVQNELLNISLVRDTCLYGRYALTKGLVPITPLSLSKRLALGTFQKHWHNSGGDGYQDVERWWLKLEEDGSFTLHSDGLTTYQGQTTMIKDRLWLRFTGTPLCVTEPGAAALGADSSAVYQWRIDTKGIQLDAVLDGCSERRRMMSEGLWMRKHAP